MSKWTTSVIHTCWNAKKLKAYKCEDWEAYHKSNTLGDEPFWADSNGGTPICLQQHVCVIKVSSCIVPCDDSFVHPIAQKCDVMCCLIQDDLLPSNFNPQIHKQLNQINIPRAIAFSKATWPLSRTIGAVTRRHVCWHRSQGKRTWRLSQSPQRKGGHGCRCLTCRCQLWCGW